MAKVCDLCGKKAKVGRQSKHRRGVAGRQWAKRAQKTVKVFKPNLQKVQIEGVKMVLCAKCLKLLKKRKEKEGELKEKVAAA